MWRNMVDEIATVACPLCDTPMRLVYPHIRGTQYNVCECPRCTLQRLDPQPTWEEIKAIYSADYYKAWGMQAGETPDVAAMKKSTFRRRLRQIRRHQKSGDILDVGTAS